MFPHPVLTALATAAVLAAGAGPAAAAGPIQVPEGSGGPHTVDVPVSALAPSLVARSIGVAAADGTATAGQDFDALSPTLQVSLAPFQILGSVPVVIHGDTLPEDDEAFTLHGAGLVDQQVVIVDDDPAPVVAIGDATVHEHDGTASFPVTLSGPSGVPVTVRYETGDGSATAPGDYTAASGELSFAPGETRKTVDVAIADDAVHEDTETMQARVTGATRAAIGDKLATGTILDDDPAPAPPPAQPQQSRGMVGDAVYVADPSVRYLGLTGKNHRVRLRLTCPKAFDCPGALSLRWGGRKVGGASFSLHKGTDRVVTVTLSAKAWRSLRRHHRLRLVAHLDSGRTARFTVKR
jgi:Calx-beta domain